MGISCAACDLQDENPEPPTLYNGLKHVLDSIKATRAPPMIHQRQVCQQAELCESCNALRGDGGGELYPQTGDGGGYDGHVKAVSTREREEMLFCGGNWETSNHGAFLLFQGRRLTADTVDVRRDGEAAGQAGYPGTSGEHGLDPGDWSERCDAQIFYGSVRKPVGFAVQGGDERGEGSGGAQTNGVIEGWLYMPVYPGRDEGESECGRLVISGD